MPPATTPAAAPSAEAATPSAPLAAATPDTDAVGEAIRSAGTRVPPLWPLDHFVAVNPYVGLADHDVGSAAERVARVAGARTFMPRSFYARALESGRITDEHLARALDRVRARRGMGPGADTLPGDAGALRAAAFETDADGAVEPVPTVSDAVARLTGRAWTRWVTERVSSWAGAHFDRGQASWTSPWKEEGPWRAWKAEATIDRTPDVMGVRGFRRVVADLPDDPAAAVARMLSQLHVPGPALELYLHRLLMTVSGWAGWMRYQVWEAELRGGEHAGMTEILAIRLAWEVGLLRAFEGRGARAAWERARERLAEAARVPAPGGEMAVERVLQEAYELGWQDHLLRELGERGGADGATGNGADPSPGRPDVQAIFCIDVRSEVYRRALEASGDGIDTLGFAGFFGFPVEYIPLGASEGGARCPVLLTPSAVIPETVDGEGGAETRELTRLRELRRKAAAAWLSFKLGAVSCFAFVGPIGLGYIRKLVTDTLLLSRPVPEPSTKGLPAGARQSLQPDLAPASRAGRETGMRLEERVETAAGALGAMSLTDGFARLVVLAGHGSTVVNNPHRTGLDCGACGGHSGEENARVAVTVLNDPMVREGLMARGIRIPDDTVFVAARHDTTTDDVTLLDLDRIPPTHADDVSRLQARLAEAGARARAERAPSLAVTGDVDARIRARSRDWSQVRPEWGLAGCAAFIAAPRARTRGLDLGGRVFLHDYVWSRDDDASVLELIMTAPVVVASWINLQYYGTTVDNRRLGCGNKTLHNVVGALGVLEGNAGDLRTGLPWQSVHDGHELVHEPLRLNVVIEAPREAMDGVMEDHEHLRHLVEHGWIHLWAMDGSGRVTHRCQEPGRWSPVGGA